MLAAAVAEAGVGVLVNASAVGYYGNTKDRQVDETASAGSGFLAQLCQDWEAATAAAQQVGARVVLARTGLVLAPSGGCWGGCAAVLAGPGRPPGQRPPVHLLDQPRRRGPGVAVCDLARRAVRPVNLTGPAPVTNAEFTAALGRAVRRPTRWFCRGSRCAPCSASSPTNCCAASAPSPPFWNAPVSGSTTTRLVRR
ncbi:hypothetical protein I552_10114 [Mycobacterium xenopi 3993]|nr:hypothetical protein I552_10114 [Mycobacterium xenopi 3993]